MRSVLLAALLAALALPAAAQSTLPAEAAASQIEGVVTDAETGDPLVGAGVMIPDLEIGAVSGRDGRFVLEGVPAGAHTVRVGAYTYHAALFDVEVAEGEAAPLDAPLRPGAAAGCADHGEDDADG
jgi:iron complex outermembrane receptor protein